MQLLPISFQSFQECQKKRHTLLDGFPFSLDVLSNVGIAPGILLINLTILSRFITSRYDTIFYEIIKFSLRSKIDDFGAEHRHLTDVSDCEDHSYGV